MKRAPRRARAAGTLFAAAAFALAGCSGLDDAAGQRVGAAPVYGSLELEGPWAAEFENAYATAESDFVREVLQDGQVTDLEYAEVLARFEACMTEVGITLEPAGRGTYGYSFSRAFGAERAYQRELECFEQHDGMAVPLYWWVRANPENLDLFEIRAKCLVDAGVVAAGFTADELREHERSFQEYPPGLDESAREQWDRCEDDPLGLLGSYEQ